MGGGIYRCIINGLTMIDRCLATEESAASQTAYGYRLLRTVMAPMLNNLPLSWPKFFLEVGDISSYNYLTSKNT